jgi:branched-subunit amino acid transport protein
VLIHNFLLQYTVNKNVVLLQEEFEDTKRVKEAVKTEEGLIISRSFPHSWPIAGFVTWATRWLPLVEQELPTLPNHLRSQCENISHCIFICLKIFHLYYFYSISTMLMNELWKSVNQIKLLNQAAVKTYIGNMI